MNVLYYATLLVHTNITYQLRQMLPPPKVDAPQVLIKSGANIHHKNQGGTTALRVIKNGTLY